MTEKGNKNVNAVIPAAGRSQRMQSFKPLLPFDKERSFIEKIVDEFVDFGCNEIIVVINKDIYKVSKDTVLKKLERQVEIIINENLDYGRYYSIKLGLQKLKNKEYCFIHNCDNPLINQEILSGIFSHKFSGGYVSPVYDDHGGHPVLISKVMIKRIIESEENAANFREVIQSFPLKKININTKDILANINTINDYNQLLDY